MTIALTDSHRGRILSSICAALRAMTVAGGYPWNVASDSVQTDPIDTLGVPADRRPFFCVEPSPDGPRDFLMSNLVRDDFRVLITGIVDATGTDPNRKIATGEALARAIEKAVTQDITRGGLAIDTRVRTPEIVVGTGTSQTVAIVQELECPFIRTYGQP